MPRARAPQQEKPPQWEARSPQRGVAPTRRNQRKPVHSNEDPTQPNIKINKINLFKKKKDGQKVKDLHLCRTFLSYLIAHEEKQLLNITSFLGVFLIPGLRVQRGAFIKRQRLAGTLWWKPASPNCQDRGRSYKGQALHHIRVFSAASHNHIFPLSCKTGRGEHWRWHFCKYWG